MRFKIAILLHFLFFGIINSGLSLEIPDRPENYVNDYAGVISPTFLNILNTKLLNFDRQTSNQIFVAIFKSLEEENLEDFSIQLAEKWKPGVDKVDNGVLLTVFIDDKKIRIEVGYGLEGVLTDLVSSQIINQKIVPHFKEGNFETGLISGISAIEDALSGEGETRSESSIQQNQLQITAQQIKFFLTLLIWISVVLFFVDLIRYFHFKKHKNRMGYNFVEWWIRFAILLFAIQILFRILLFFAYAKSGGYSGSRSGFGGFSGGRGGSFGGGGSSGSW